jgi:NhaA family Na+:H+ antiporter
MLILNNREMMMSLSIADNNDTNAFLQGQEKISPFQRFFNKIVSGSYPILLAVILAMIWANLLAASYHSFWHTPLSLSFGQFSISKSLVHWIDEALMALFFFTVGLEIKREILVGGLSSPRQAALPIAAAVGGMLVPATIFYLFNNGTTEATGWAIPMATDIAFSLAVLAFLKDKVPSGLRIFLTAFAIADDLGAVMVIALFYTKTIVWQNLIFSTLFFVALGVANTLWIRKTLVYIVLGMGMWFTILGSGVHATIAGVIVALFIPARGKYDTETFTGKVKAYLNRIVCENDCGHSILMNQQHLDAVQAIEIACSNVETPLQRLEHHLQSWVAYLVLPLFALANSGLALRELDVFTAIRHPVTLGVMFGLVFGKPLGILSFTYLCSKLLQAPLLQGIKWSHIAGVGLLGGIGFTMSLFISGLSFTSAQVLDFSKLGIIAGSVVSGIAGWIVLGFLGRSAQTPAFDKSIAPGERL